MVPNFALNLRAQHLIQCCQVLQCSPSWEWKLCTGPCTIKP